MLKKIINNWEIPEINEDRLLELVKQIKPIVRNPQNKNKLYKIKEVDEKKQSFTFNPSFTKKAKKICEIGHTFSLHSSHPALWKPSMAEILAFIQNHHRIDSISYVSVSFLENHSSGNGNIGKVTLYSNTF